jgi:hypothetical protein
VFIMSENHLERSTLIDRVPDPGPTTATLFVHAGAATRLSVQAIPAENRVVLDVGEDSRSTLHLFLSGPELDRLHALLDEASLDLGRPVPSAAEAAPEAYASGWDAAIAFCDASIGEPVPASATGGPDA